MTARESQDRENLKLKRSIDDGHDLELKVGIRTRIRLALEKVRAIFVLDLLNLVCSVVFLGFYIWQTTQNPVSWFRFVSFGLAVFFLLDTAVRFTFQDSKFIGLTWQAGANILSFVPQLIHAWWTPMIVLDYFRIVPVFILLNRYFRYDPHSMRDNIRDIGLVAGMGVFVAAGVIHTFEVDIMDSQRLDYLETLYFVIVSITTVGFGDIAMRSLLGRLSIVAMIVVGLSLLPVLSARIMQVMSHKKTYGDPKNRNAFVVVAGTITPLNLRRFLKQFYCKSHGYRNLKMVLVLPGAPCESMAVIMADTRYKEHLSFISGDLTRKDTVKTLKLANARAVFILQDSDSAIDDRADSEAVLLAMLVARSAPLTRLFLHTRRVSAPTGHTVPTTRLIEAIVSEGARVQGLAAVLLNLFRSFSLDDEVPQVPQAPGISLVNLPGRLSSTISRRAGDRPGTIKYQPWRDLYSPSLNVSLYRTALSPEIDAVPFAHAALTVYHETGAILLAVEFEPDGAPPQLRFFAGATGKVYGNQRCFVLARDAAHASAVKLIGRAHTSAAISLPLTHMGGNARRDHDMKLNILRRRWAEEQDAGPGELAQLTARMMEDPAGLGGVAATDTSDGSFVDSPGPETATTEASLSGLSVTMSDTEFHSVASDSPTSSEEEEGGGDDGEVAEYHCHGVHGHTVFVGGWDELRSFMALSDRQSHPLVVWLSATGKREAYPSVWRGIRRHRRLEWVPGNPLMWADWRRAGIFQAQSVVVTKFFPDCYATSIVVADLLRANLGAVASPIVTVKVDSVHNIRVLDGMGDDRPHYCPMFVQGSIVDTGAVDGLMASSFYNPHLLRFLTALCLPQGDTPAEQEDAAPACTLKLPESFELADEARHTQSVLSRQVVAAEVPDALLGRPFGELLAVFLGQTPSLLPFAIFRPVGLRYADGENPLGRRYDPEDPLGVPIVAPKSDTDLEAGDQLLCFKEVASFDTEQGW